MLKRSLLSIGLMSGTSMDGIDAALLNTDGKIAIQELGSEFFNYDLEFKLLLKAAEYAVRKCDGSLETAKIYYPQAIENYLKNELKIVPDTISNKLKDLSHYFHGNENTPITFDEMIQRSTELHAKVVAQLLAKTGYTPKQIDVIGYHGQTLFHRPSARITIQIGDGEWLAKLTGITVVNDFRSHDVANGGQGAPFAPLYHQALAVRDKKYPVVIVNCGGIANISVIRGGNDEDIVSGFDTGPGNGLIDRYVKQRTQGVEAMDTDAKYGSQGKVHEDMVRLLYKEAVKVNEKNYLDMKPPKSLDIGNLMLIPELNDLSIQDGCATLEAFTADTIVDSIQYVPQNPPKFWVLTGGGWKNPVILKRLNEKLKERLDSDFKVMTADEAGWNSKAMEAQIFAYLAVRSLKGMPISIPNTTGVPRPLSGGSVAFSLGTKLLR